MPIAAAGRDHRVVLVGLPADAGSSRNARIPSASSSAIRSTRSICCRWSKPCPARRPRAKRWIAPAIYFEADRHACAAPQEGDRRLYLRPPAGSAVARGAAHSRQGCRHDRRHRRFDRLFGRHALGLHGLVPDLSPGGRSRRHARISSSSSIRRSNCPGPISTSPNGTTRWRSASSKAARRRPAARPLPRSRPSATTCSST